MTNYLIFNGIDSREYGIYLSGEGTYNVPEKDYEFISVPGRSGDVCFWNNRWKNITIEYPCYMKGLQSNLDAFMYAMTMSDGYCVLQDSYHDYYREAVFAGPVQIKPGQANKRGSFTLSFNCKPQKILEERLTGQGVLPASDYDRQPILTIKAVKSASSQSIVMNEFDRVIVTFWQKKPGTLLTTGWRMEVALWFGRGFEGWNGTTSKAESSVVYDFSDTTKELSCSDNISIIDSERYRACVSMAYNTDSFPLSLPAGYDYDVTLDLVLGGETVSAKESLFSASIVVEGRRFYI